MTGNRINFFWIALVATYILVHIFLIPHPWGKNAISDAGIFSILTIALASIALIRLLITTRQIPDSAIKLSLYALAYIILIYILREADFHRLFTDEHITRDKFYTDPNIDLKQKILAGIPMALFFLCFFYVLIKYAKFVFTRVLKLQPWAISVFLWGITIVASQALDKSSLNEVYVGRAIEELLEFCAAGYLMLAVFLSTNMLKKFYAGK